MRKRNVRSATGESGTTRVAPKLANIEVGKISMAPDLNDIWRRNRTYISYDALRRNAPTGRSSVGRTKSTPASAYTRGCSATTRCRG